MSKELDFSDFVASPFVAGQRIRLIDQPYIVGTVTATTDHGFFYKLDNPQTIGRLAWGQTSDSGEVYSRSWYPHGGFELESNQMVFPFMYQ